MMEEATEQEVTVDVGTTEEPQKETEGGEQQPEEGQKEPEAAAEPEQPVNPFSDADVEHMLHEEKATSRDDGWKFMCRDEFAEIWRKSEPDKAVHLIKGLLHFPGIPPHIVVDLIYDIELRRRWDLQFPTIDLVEEHADYRVVYWLAKMPPVVADRDLVQYNTKRVDEATGATFVMYRNATHPSRPPRRGVVRAETILSGSIIRADPQDPNSTRVSILLQNDAKGWIPHFIVNMLSAKAPIQWRNTLSDFYFNTYGKELGLVVEKEEAKGEEGQAEAAEGEKKEEEKEGEGEVTEPTQEQEAAQEPKAEGGEGEGEGEGEGGGEGETAGGEQ